MAKDHYDAYQEIFDKVIATLKVFDQKSAAAGNWKKKQAEGDLVDSSTIVDINTKPDISVQKKGAESGGDSTTESILMIVGLCAVGFIFIKMRKKKKKK